MAVLGWIFRLPPRRYRQTDALPRWMLSCPETCYLRSWALISRMLCEVLVHPPALDSIAKHRWAELSPNRPVLPKSQRFSSPSCDLARLRCRAALLQPFPSPLDGKHVKALLLRSWPESGPVCGAKEWAGDIISFLLLFIIFFFNFLPGAVCTSSHRL